MVVAAGCCLHRSPAARAGREVGPAAGSLVVRSEKPYGSAGAKWGKALWIGENTRGPAGSRRRYPQCNPSVTLPRYGRPSNSGAPLDWLFPKGRQRMTEPTSLLDIIDQSSDIARRIVRLLGELRPVTEQIIAGNRDPAILAKERRLQDKIARLDEQRDMLRDEWRNDWRELISD